MQTGRGLSPNIVCILAAIATCSLPLLQQTCSAQTVESSVSIGSSSFDTGTVPAGSSTVAAVNGYLDSGGAFVATGLSQPLAVTLTRVQGGIASSSPFADSAWASTSEGVSKLFVSSLAPASDGSGTFSYPYVTATSIFSDSFTVNSEVGNVVPVSSIGGVSFTISLDDTAVMAGGYNQSTLGNSNFDYTFSTTNAFMNYTDSASGEGATTLIPTSQPTYNFGGSTMGGPLVPDGTTGFIVAIGNNNLTSVSSTFTTDEFALNNGEINALFDLSANATYGIANLFGTATISGMTLYDLNGNPIAPTGFTISSGSGATYAFTNMSPAPESSALTTFALILFLGLVFARSQLRSHGGAFPSLRVSAKGSE